jgi:hypothetical protein
MDMEPVDHGMIVGVVDTTVLTKYPTGACSADNSIDLGNTSIDLGERLVVGDVYHIEHVLARRRNGRRFQYLIQWVGYPPSANSWIYRSDAETEGALATLLEFDASCLG